MTVMPSGSDVADKAVSTEDASEMIRLDAVLAALVETKIEAMKRASLSSTKGKWTSAPASPRRPRLMSSSTASSSQNRNHHDNFSNKHFGKSDIEHREAKAYRHRRYDSAPCQQFIDELNDHSHHKHHNAIAHKELKGRRRASEMIHRTPKRKRRYSRRISSHAVQDVDSPIELPELLDVDRLHEDLTLIDFDRTREALSDNGDFPSLHQSAYVSQSAAHLKLAYEDEDYVALNIEDEFDGDSIVSYHYAKSGTREHGRDAMAERYHRPRRKRKRKKHPTGDYLPEVSDVPQVVLLDHDELPPRARWTIVATACLLFAMSLLLVGVTLRMAPIIDDMDKLENPDCYLHGLYPPNPHAKTRRSNSMNLQTEKPRRSRQSIDSGYSIRRSHSQIGTRPRTKSCSRFTPLGDDRRASIRCKRSPSRRRRNSSANESHRRPSLRVSRKDAPQIQSKAAGKVKKNLQTETPQTRRHRRIVGIILGTFMFLLVASVVVVVVTLTHSTFHKPPIGNKELAQHRAQHKQPLHHANLTFRKENEELINSLNRDTSVPSNSTAASL